MSLCLKLALFDIAFHLAAGAPLGYMLGKAFYYFHRTMRARDANIVAFILFIGVVLSLGFPKAYLEWTLSITHR